MLFLTFPVQLPEYYTYSSSLNEIAARNPASTLSPTELAFPMCTASGIMAAAIIVSMALATNPSAKQPYPIDRICRQETSPRSCADADLHHHQTSI